MATIIPMTKIRQDVRDFYVGAMRASDIVRVGRVAEWKDDAGDGYQRAPESARIRKLATFLKNEATPLLPTSILLSHRGAPLPKTDMGNGLVHIEIADDEVLWIVDGQHRIAGLDMAIDKFGLERLKDFQLPVVIVEFDTVTEEAHQFQVLNENMKKVNTMLARRLLEMRLKQGGGDVKRQLKENRRLWQAESVTVIKRLTDDPSSVWFGRIQPPNTSKQPEHIVRELSFSTSLKPLLTEELATHLGLERITEFVARFWEAWRQVAPEAFDAPESHVIQKTPGVFSLHLVARYVLRLFEYRKNADPSVDEIRVVLEDAGEAAESLYWQTGNADGAAMAGSMAGFKIVADSIIETLQANGQTI